MQILIIWVCGVARSIQILNISRFAQVCLINYSSQYTEYLWPLNILVLFTKYIYRFGQRQSNLLKWERHLFHVKYSIDFILRIIYGRQQNAERLLSSGTKFRKYDRRTRRLLQTPAIPHFIAAVQ